jgi:peptidoglycan/xylan/chitin deacetylase (PgdA/CDA1 family)
MTWEQIREISEENFVHIGNHSHSHEYLVDLEPEKIKSDIKKSIEIFNKEIGYNSEFFSYPFGEYSLKFKSIIKNLGFNFAFGQHSGVVDDTKDFFELPRFPINEKYGSLKRFDTLMNTLPLKVKSILPSEKYINDKTNPPKIIIDFYNDVDNLKSINCYSNEGNKWRNSEIKFIDDFKLEIVIQEKFTTERGRVNCSLRENNGSWRWLGMQFVVAEK